MSSDRIVGDLAKRSLKPTGFRTVKKLDLFTTSSGNQGLLPKFHTLLAGGATECSEHYYADEGRRDFRAYDKTLVACGAASGG